MTIFTPNNTLSNAATTVASALNLNTLGSMWDGLSPHLIASFYEVAKTGEDKWGTNDQTDPIVVKAPLTEANMEMVLNWQSPFEQAGPESRAPALMSMLQSGALQPVVDALVGKQSDSETMQKVNQKSKEFLSQFEGRTGITKLNSTQVFNGMPPVKITVTALFRAWRDSASEVEAPFNKLMEWALPIALSKDGSVLARMSETAKGEMGYVEALMPSKSPTRIAMKYKRMLFCPLVIESIGAPINSPIDSDGRFVQLAVPMTLCSLTAIDRKDWSDAVNIL
ncbi:MAG: hypothetical protein NC211_03620 [Alistipes senegalensis]|nr:hypothetical protein [Oxalobacter formigenes]MCM1280907.1 hypothetical protein [Alistipes senegalensis]